MSNIITGGVTSGLLGAASSIKLAQSSKSAYQHAKVKNDDAGMQRAMGYMTDFASDARSAAEKARVALSENIKNARVEDRTGRTSEVNPARQEAINTSSIMLQELQSANERILFPIDTVEISPKGIDAYENEQMAAENVSVLDLLQTEPEDSYSQQIVPEEEDTAAVPIEENESLQQSIPIEDEVAAVPVEEEEPVQQTTLAADSDTQHDATVDEEMLGISA